MASTTEAGVSGGGKVKFLSWNVGGINSPVKRSRVFSHIKKLNGGIIFLQETHIRNAEHSRLLRPWIGQVFHSSFNFKTRGAAILIDKKLQFTPSGTISDPDGRYVIVTGLLYQTPVVLACVYAPNWDDANFMKGFLSKLPNLNTHHLVLGGDINCVIDCHLDRSSTKTATPSKMSQTLSTFMTQCGGIDPWRFLHPTDKQFSFFSHVHHSYTRIDYFFLDKMLLPTLTSAEYSAITISDHAPLFFELSFKSKPKAARIWRLDTTLLSSAEFCGVVSQAINGFIATNLNDETAPSLLWETLKANVRGVIISYTAYKNRERLQRQQELVTLLKGIDCRYATAPTPELYKEKLRLETEYNLLTTREAEQLLLKSRGIKYEHGDKAGRLLAHQLKGRVASQLISQVHDPTGTLTNDPVQIGDAFMKFYAKLYTSESPEDNSAMTDFFRNQDIPKISSDDSRHLDEPLSLEEVLEAIKKMQSGKSPGLDGYPVEFYKKFSIQLAPLLLAMYNDSLKRSSLPPTLTQASISLILKKDKDPTNCSSYRPISLLNVDIKILAKLIACRLETILPLVISEDQTGFIKNRHSFTNIRRLLSIINLPGSSENPECVISLDAEKAFDRVEWSYLFVVLEQFGFGEKLLSWVRLLYTSPQACVSTNNSHSKFFPLSRGTRQGCPLSPLLFALAIEPLSIALKVDGLFSGVQRGGIEHKTSLYADDLLLYVSDPVTNVPRILSLLRTFGSFSGYKLNIQKSECFPINKRAHDILQYLQPFHCTTSGFKYLGVNITPSLDSLCDQNLNVLTTKVKADLQRWGSLPVSLAGRVQSIKMNVLPRYLYLFQCLPVFLTKSFFEKLDSIISSYIWEGKPPRIKLALLRRSRERGGLGLPDFRYYYWAANLHKIVLWLSDEESNWCTLEAGSCVSSSLRALVCSSLPLSPSEYSSNPVVISTLKIWAQMRKRFGWTSLCLLTPICNNHLFLPAQIDSSFASWGRKGLRYMCNLYIEGQFASFNDLRETFELRRSDQFRYFQIRHFVRTHSSEFPQVPSPTGIQRFLPAATLDKGQVSYLYDIIPRRDVPIDRIKQGWESELGVTFSDDWWDQALETVNSSSSCARLSLIQFKVLHRIHYSKVKLSRIYPDVDDKCNRCSLSPGNLSHLFWSCPKLIAFWKYFFSVLSEVLGMTLLPCYQIAIFGTTEEGVVLTNTQANVIAFASLIARRRILLQWKAVSPPSTASWLSDIMSFLKLEKIKFTIKGSSDKFFTHWQPLLAYVDGLKSLPLD